MTACRSCRWSFPVMDHERNQVRMCWPGGDRSREQIVPKEPCGLYEDAEDSRDA